MLKGIQQSGLITNQMKKQNSFSGEKFVCECSHYMAAPFPFSLFKFFFLFKNLYLKPLFYILFIYVYNLIAFDKVYKLWGAISIDVTII